MRKSKKKKQPEVSVINGLPKITPPTYKLDNYVLNEYELRCLQAEISEGRWPQLVGKTITDERGNTSQFREDGVLTHNIHGYDIISGFVLRMFRTKRK